MENKQCCKTVYTITGSGIGIDTSNAGTNADFCCMVDREQKQPESVRNMGLEKNAQAEEAAGCCGDDKESQAGRCC